MFKCFYFLFLLYRKIWLNCLHRLSPNWDFTKFEGEKHKQFYQLIPRPKFGTC